MWINLKDVVQYISINTSDAKRIVFIYNCSPNDDDFRKRNVRLYSELQSIKQDTDNEGKQNWGEF